MSEAPSSSPRPSTPEEIRENFAAAITLFQQYCGSSVSTVEQVEALLGSGVTCVTGTYEGAQVRLYPPKLRQSLPTLTFNLGDVNAFERLRGVLEQKDVQMVIWNPRG